MDYKISIFLKNVKFEVTVCHFLMQEFDNILDMILEVETRYKHLINDKNNHKIYINKVFCENK